MSAQGTDERGAIHRFLARDHARLDGLLRSADASTDGIDAVAFEAFRAGLLKHIAMEEKILLPSARRARGGDQLAIAERLRLDHGVLATLLVPSPTPSIVATIRSILAAHNRLEEQAGGLYDACDDLVGADAADLVAQLRAQPDVPMNAHNDGPLVMPAVYRVLRRAGYVEEADRLEASLQR